MPRALHGRARPHGPVHPAGHPGTMTGVTDCDLVIVLRYRKAVTYGFHVLLGALEEHETPTRYEVRFARSLDETVAEIESSVQRAPRVLVLWSFYSPDAEPLAKELA